MKLYGSIQWAKYRFHKQFICGRDVIAYFWNEFPGHMCSYKKDGRFRIFPFTQGTCSEQFETFLNEGVSIFFIFWKLIIFTGKLYTAVYEQQHYRLDFVGEKQRKFQQSSSSSRNALISRGQRKTLCEGRKEMGCHQYWKSSRSWRVINTMLTSMCFIAFLTYIGI